MRRSEWLLPSALIGTGERASGRRTPRDWFVDVALFLSSLVIGLVLFDYGSRTGPNPDWLLATDLLAGGVACLALWGRRRWPVGTAFALAGLAAFSASAGFACMIALFTVAVHRPTRTTAQVTVANMLFALVYTVARPDENSTWWGDVLLILVLTSGIVAWGLFVRARRQLFISLRERAERAEAEQLLRLEQARTLERTRIAREMHDVLAHRISLVSLHAGALEFHPDASPDEVAKAAGVIRASAHQALVDLREVIGVLRGPDSGHPSPPQPTLADVGRLLEESRAAGMRIVDEGGTVPADVPASVGRAAYRILQEGLTNARKHAPGTLVTVAVSGTAGDGVDVVVRNRRSLGAPDSPGIPGAGQGLAGLRERTALAGGRLEHGPREEGDFELRAWLPWPGSETGAPRP